MPKDQTKSATTEPATRSKRRWGCLLIIASLIGLWLTTVGFLAFSALGRASLQISPETTYITSPLKSDGKQVDYFVAWEQESYPEGIASDENGYRLIVQHLGPSPDSTPHATAEVCRKLGLDPGAIAADMTWQEPYDFLEAYAPDSITVLESRLGRPWTLEDLPMMEAWLTGNSPAMDLVGTAVRKPCFRIPVTRETEDKAMILATLPHITYLRSFARALQARARFRLGTGDIDGAIDDMVTCKRLGRHVGYNGMLIEMLVGIAIEEIADSIGIAQSLEHPPTKEQLERLVKELSDLPRAGDVKKAMLSERYTALDIIQSLALGKSWDPDLETPVEIRAMGIDWNIVARGINGHFDNVLAGGPTPTPNRRPMGASAAAAISTLARSQWLADTLAPQLLPRMGAALEATRRRHCVERIRRISLAMLLYETDHGTLPPAYTADADGNPLHSWRVVLLPYLGQQTLYDRIRLDEPWDSEHNRKLHGQAVAFYQCPSAGLAPGQTAYSVVVGPEMPLQGAQGKRLADFGPKSADMILVVERTQPVCWMDPTQEVSQAVADVGIGVNAAQGGEIASPHPGGANFGLRDGSCRFLSSAIYLDVFHGLLRGTFREVP